MKPHDKWDSTDLYRYDSMQIDAETIAYQDQLYKERAEWADLESDVEEGRKYFRVGGFFWMLADWLDRQAKEGRREVQEELDQLQYGRMSMHVKDYADYEDANLPPPNWPRRVLGVVAIALLVAVLVFVGGKV